MQKHLLFTFRSKMCYRRGQPSSFFYKDPLALTGCMLSNFCVVMLENSGRHPGNYICNKELHI